MTTRRYRDLRLVRHEAVWRGRRLEAVRPLVPPRRAYPLVMGGRFFVYGDGRAFLRLAALAWYAALHKEALVHVPLRGAVPSAIQEWVAQPVRACDLVFAHHSLAFRPSAWRDVRSRLGHGVPFKASIERPGEWLGDRFNDVGRAYDSTRRDALDLSHHADTLFVVGSLPALGFVASALHGMSRCTELGDHIHLRGAARNRLFPHPEREDDLELEYYTEAKMREWEETREAR